jgi:tripartite-type tricarboxylate transporter receptor subunit TctC
MKTLKRLILAFTFAASGAVLVQAQSYPSRQVQIVVAYPAGGAADIIKDANLKVE